MYKKFVKSLRYTDESLLSTNDFFVESCQLYITAGIKAVTLVRLDKICQTCYFSCRSMKS